MIEFPEWVIALAGIFPYRVGKKRDTNGTIFTIRALIWSLTISWSSGGCDWMLQMPLFERARHLFWSALFKERLTDHEEISAEVVGDPSPSHLVDVVKRKRTRC